MRTTLDLNERLLIRSRKLARRQGSTLTAVVEEALAAYLTPAPKQEEGFKLEIETERGRYIAGVEIADREALYDVMEGRR